MKQLVSWLLIGVVLALALLQHVLAAILIGAVAVGFGAVLPYITGSVSRKIEPHRRMASGVRRLPPRDDHP